MSGSDSTSVRVSLDDALHFTADDLVANREGRLGVGQRERLQRSARRTLSVGILGFILVGLGAALLIFLGQRNDSMILTIIGIALTVINAAIVGFLVQSRLRLQSDLTQPVTVDESLVHRTLRISGRSPTYLLKFDDREIVVNKRAFNAFIEGAAYKLYRSAGSKTLIAAELIGMIDN